MDILRVLMVPILIGIVSLNLVMVRGNLMFKVEHKYKNVKRTLKEIRTRDAQRHARMLGAADLPLGGNGQPTHAGLYFTKIQIGNPPKEFHVQVDTGSDFLWVNCEGCDKCPKKSGLGVELNNFNPNSSSTSKLVNCDDSQCSMIYGGSLSGCESNMLCQFEVTYADGSTTSGYFIQDILKYNQTSRGSKTTGNGTIVFGCGSKQSGDLSTPDEALDGIMGFGQANSSAISQLAADGKVPKMFSHCLDNDMGGGIFSIGQLVEPKLNSTPMIPNQVHYNVVLKNVEVDSKVVEVPSSSAEDGGGAIIDSGSTLAYLPDDVYDEVVDTILSKEPNLQIHDVEDQYKCFAYPGNIDEGFPTVIFHFANNLTLKVYPRDYFFRFNGDKWCVGWMKSGLQARDGKDITILGDIVLSNRVVFYDLENQTIGWTEYNCSSSIKIKDESTGAVYSHAYTPVGDMGISSKLQTPWTWAFFIVLVLVAFS